MMNHLTRSLRRHNIDCVGSLAEMQNPHLVTRKYQVNPNWETFYKITGHCSSNCSNSKRFHSVQFSSVAQLCPTLCDPMNRSTPGLPVCHQLLEFTQTHAHRVGDAIQPSHPLSSPSPLAPNPSQHQGLFQWVGSSHQVAKVLKFQLQHQSFQWTSRTALL